MFFVQKNIFIILFIVSGWTGVLTYFYFHSPSISLIGLALYFAALLILVLMYFSAEFCLYYNFRIDPTFDPAARGRFFREFKRRFLKLFPKLRILFHEKYDYTKIHLETNCRNIHSRQPYNKTNCHKEANYLVASDPEAWYRFKYRDPRFQEFLEKKYKIPKSRRLLHQLFVVFTYILFFVPAEDGIFLVMPYFLGINYLTVTAFSLLFGFLHFWKDSFLGCTLKSVQRAFILLLIFPRYGLLTCVSGHIIQDFIAVGLKTIYF